MVAPNQSCNAVVPGPVRAMVLGVGCLSMMQLTMENARAAETSLAGGAGLNYKIDDNIRVATTNRISLSGWIVDGWVIAKYASPRMEADLDLKLSSERYQDTDLDRATEGAQEPEPSDFDSDNQDVNGNLSYVWERHQLALNARYWRDSTLNTQFLDTGLGGLRQIEGATRRESVSVRPNWLWDITERQQLNTSMQWQAVDYESLLFVDYDYETAQMNWSYMLSERMQFQVAPHYSNYENEAVAPVTSVTYGLQAGFVWAISEKWKLDFLGGTSHVETEIDGGYFIFNPEKFEIEYIEFEDQKGEGFTGNISLELSEEMYGARLNVSSRYSPSGNGYMQLNTEGRATFFWEPKARLRFDIDTRVGQSDSGDDRVDNEREYSEVGFRVGYQFAEKWWMSTRYRYRTQEYSRSDAGQGSGSHIAVSISYKLPKEIL
jgi:hypothetical protein